MCAIAGIYSRSGAPVDRERLERMGAAMAHRGPDGRGLFSNGPVGLAHRRLAIIDTSERAAQPMVHAGTGSALCLNGEIYNFVELKRELVREGEAFRSDSDTEVLLAGLVRHGMRFLSKVDGDFAFAYWDARERQLYIARDRLGVKPLYVHSGRGEVLFASELRGLFAGGVPKELRPAAIRDYLRFRYVSGEDTMFSGIRSLPPGTWLQFAGDRETSTRYWTVRPEANAPRSYAEGLERLGSALGEAVSRRLRSDVGTGLLLSGGIDSTLIAMLAHRHGGRALHAVTYDMPGSLSEAAPSAKTARALGFAHSVVTPSRDMFEHLPEAVRALERPLGDSIILPVFQLFRECAKHMKVVLSGEGADEIFGGYAHHQILRRWCWVDAHGLQGARRLCARILGAVPTPVLQAIVPYPVKLNAEARGRAVSILGSRTLHEAYDFSRALMNVEEVDRLVEGDFGSAAEPEPAADGRFEEVLSRDLSGWLPDYGLLRTDKLSMAHGLECRVPYLSHEVVEAALALTVQAAGSFFSGEKKPIRDWAAREFPGTSWPKKQPFFFPVEATAPAALAEACDLYLSPRELRNGGVLSPEAVRKLRDRPMDFLTGKKLVSLIILQAWLKEAFVESKLPLEFNGVNRYDKEASRGPHS